MRLLTLWVVLVSLAFSSAHDLLLSPLDAKEINIILDDPIKHSSDSSSMGEVHNLLHFVAICSLDTPTHEYWLSAKHLSLTALPATPPQIENSYKPPIV